MDRAEFIISLEEISTDINDNVELIMGEPDEG
jgi:hypothetical protein